MNFFVDFAIPGCYIGFIRKEDLVMTQGERVKKVRKTRQLTLEKFGEKIGLKKNTMSAIETGRNSLTEANIKSICRETLCHRLPINMTDLLRPFPIK